MTHSPAMIATTESKLSAERAEYFTSSKTQYGKKDLQVTDSSGNSFSIALRKAEELRDNVEKDAAVKKSEENISRTPGDSGPKHGGNAEKALAGKKVAAGEADKFGKVALSESRVTVKRAEGTKVGNIGKEGIAANAKAGREIIAGENIAGENDAGEKVLSQNDNRENAAARGNSRPESIAKRIHSKSDDKGSVELAVSSSTAGTIADVLLNKRRSSIDESGKTGKAKSRANLARETSAVHHSASSRVRPGEIISEAKRVIVVDRRKGSTSETVDSARSTLTRRELRNEAHRDTVKTEPVRLDSSESKGSDNRFAIAETDIELSPRAESSTSSRSAAAELARRLDGQAGSDIVKQVRVVMNRADTGDIRINLRPDNLGNVRVRLHLEENRLTGRIFVESAAARDAFRSALDGLQTKLVESGFGAADLELSFSDDSNNGFNMNQEQKRSSTGFAEALRDFENMSVTLKNDSFGDGRVNMMV